MSEGFDQFQGTASYIASDELKHAVNVAVEILIGKCGRRSGQVRVALDGAADLGKTFALFARANEQISKGPSNRGIIWRKPLRSCPVYKPKCEGFCPR